MSSDPKNDKKLSEPAERPAKEEPRPDTPKSQVHSNPADSPPRLPDQDRTSRSVSRILHGRPENWRDWAIAVTGLLTLLISITVWLSDSDDKLESQVKEITQLLDEAWDLMGGEPNTDILVGTGGRLGKVRDRNKLEAADRKIRDALNIDANFARAYLLKGSLAHARGNLEQALEHYEMALKLDPELPGCHVCLGVLLSDLDKPDEAIKHYKKAIEIDPYDASAFSSLGVQMYNKEDYEQARELFEKALEIDPDNAVTLTNLGSTYLYEDTDKAIAYFERALDFDSDYEAAKNFLKYAHTLSF